MSRYIVIYIDFFECGGKVWRQQYIGGDYDSYKEAQESLEQHKFKYGYHLGLWYKGMVSRPTSIARILDMYIPEIID